MPKKINILKMYHDASCWQDLNATITGTYECKMKGQRNVT